MAGLSENAHQQKEEAKLEPPPPGGFMQKFRLYATRSNFYMVGRDKSRTHWKVLKIDRLEPSDLCIHEDTATYSERQCSDLLRRVHEGNKATGGLKFVTSCYGIIGFIKFLGPYYMILISKRRQIGQICGHEVYAVSKSEIIPVPSSSIRSKMVDNDIENRYKKLLCMVDLTKDFYYSYSYNVMRCLQKNTCDDNSRPILYETMFVWNEFLTREIRNILHNTQWIVALVYGFFKQVVLSLSGRDLKLILIARRSRHYAGTRYLRRGVNEKGRVANDVETEQILAEVVDEGFSVQISSVVQNRGSIPLFWSQETSRLNLKPDIILSKRDQRYRATRLHFEDLSRRYGNPIIVLNLVKTNEKKPRESILRAEFANAIEVINKDLPEENRLKFLHWDLHKHSKSNATNVLLLLGKVAAYALSLTGFFYYQLTPALITKGPLKFPSSDNIITSDHSDKNFEPRNIEESGDLDNSDGKSTGLSSTSNSDSSFKPPLLQKGVLRTNCIDCIDRTNVAQYVYGLAALGHQLHALGFTTSTTIELDDPLAEELMSYYERMGDTLAHQYGGSAAHNKIFSERRGQWKAATHSQEFFRTLQRYYSNTYTDVEKQNAINIFLGHFQPEAGKPAIWELDSDQHHSIGRNGESVMDENGRSLYERSWSDGHILHENRSHALNSNVNRAFSPAARISHDPRKGKEILYESSPVLPTPEKESTNLRYSHTITNKEPSTESQRERFLEQESVGSVDCSNFVDLDWLSSSETSYAEEWSDRSMLTVSPSVIRSSENLAGEIFGETTPSASECGSSSRGPQQQQQHPSGTTELFHNESGNYEVLEDFSDSFIRWVTSGQMLSC